MNTIKDIKEVIYHELGHVLIYILANSDPETYICQIKMVLLGRRNAVVPVENLYYYELLQPTAHIVKNSGNVKRTLSWIILQFSGCVFESHYDKNDFKKCFCSNWGCSGKKDYDNLFHFRHYSPLQIADLDVDRLLGKFITFIEDENLFIKMEKYMDHFLSVHGSNENICLIDDDIEILLDEMKDRLIGNSMLSSFKKLISEEQKHLATLNTPKA